MARIVLNTFGSFGDLHPFLALALELRVRGHDAVLATSEVYRAKIEGEGIGFSPVRPNVGDLLGRTDLLRKLWDPKRGTVYLLRDYLLPRIKESFDDLTVASRDADLLLTHTAGLAGPLVAESLKLRWISIALQPTVFFSAYDQPVLAPAPWLGYLSGLGRWPFRLVRRVAKAQIRAWSKPLRDLRRQLELPDGGNPLFEGAFSAYGTLALFSQEFAAPQPDWPKNVTTTGFVYYDKGGAGFDAGPNDALSEFLDSGSPPVIFTLGSSAVMQPGTFYQESLAAAERLGVRAILLTGLLDCAALFPNPPRSVFLAEYAPYSSILRRGAATVHQGGIGTTAQALRAGKPMLVVPWAHDQPDNAARVCKLGVSRTLNRNRYTCENAAAELKVLLNNRSYADAAARFASKLAGEDGITNACDAIEELLSARATVKIAPKTAS